ncbi:MAG TPA: hypothetical protein VHA76_08860 [Solirubrobacterales bacterium]|nr:hypothetical protein [Solirubrobacterales bacterium]
MELRVELGRGPAGVSLVEPDVFDRLAVVVAGGGSRADLERATAAVGALDDDGEHLFIGRGELRSLAGERAISPIWLEGFEAMVDYAESKGWVDGEGRVRAHVEWAERVA